MIEMSKLREIATRDEGREEGRIKGRDEGIVEGRLEGLEKGIEKGLEKGIETVAINLLESGMSLEQVEKMTGLGLERLRELSQKN